MTRLSAKIETSVVSVARNSRKKLPSVAKTATRKGSPAATTLPNTHRSKRRTIGTAIASARARSDEIVVLTSLTTGSGPAKLTSSPSCAPPKRSTRSALITSPSAPESTYTSAWAWRPSWPRSWGGWPALQYERTRSTPAVVPISSRSAVARAATAGSSTSPSARITITATGSATS